MRLHGISTSDTSGLDHSAGSNALTVLVIDAGRTGCRVALFDTTGDTTGALDIGREGLAAALRAHDGRDGGSALLRDLASAALGPLDDVVRAVHGASNPVS